MNKGLIFLLITVLSSVNFVAQEKSFKELYAESISYLEVDNYRKALPILLDMFEKDKKNANTAFTIGNCYMNTPNEKPRAIPYFEAAKEKLTVDYQIGNYKEKSAPIEVIRFLGQAYHVNYEFEKALEEYRTYRSILSENNELDWNAVTHDMNITRNAMELQSKPVNIFVESATVLNTEYSEYRPKVNAEETFLWFTTRRKGESDLVDDEDKYFEDIYYSVKQRGEWTDPVRMSDSINTDSHDACLYISPDGQMMYVYQFDEGSDAGGSIYETKLVGNEWTKPEKLIADINSRYWETDASLNTSGNTIFFTSDRPGGMGEENRDIWMMKKLPTGDWAKIQPLPSSVNTVYDEEGPYLHPDGKTLYFSSKGHNTMGGYDIFSTELQEDGSWSDAINLGYPINTTGDDVFYFPSVDGKRAYFSSYREGGKGEQDIYIMTFEKGEPKALAIYKGISKDGNGNIVTDLMISITDVDSGEEIGIYRPNEVTGKFLFILEAGKTYDIEYELNGVIVQETIRVEEEGVQTMQKEVVSEDGVLVILDPTVDTIPDVAVVIDSIPDVAVVVDTVITQVEVNTTLNSGDTLALNSVMFVYDQVNLIEDSKKELEKIVKYMNQYPDAQLVIDGHTDSKGEDSYNYWLSSARANKIRNYLRKAGVKYSRMETHGYGESRPLADNENPDGSDNPAGRQKNRRVEFIVKK